MEWACRDRYLWIHVASSQRPRFEAVGQFLSSSPELQLTCTFTFTCNSITCTFSCDSFTWPAPPLGCRCERRPRHRRAARLALWLHHQLLHRRRLHYLQGVLLLLLHPPPGESTTPPNGSRAAAASSLLH